MKRPIATFFFASALAAASAQSITPLWVRDIAISPDASLIAFTYRGDIYTVSPAGGQAHRLTTDPRHDSHPVWSPDSRSIAFASDRQGSDDIYIMPATGGTPRRLTTHSAAETPIAFLNDTTLLFTSQARPDATPLANPSMPQTYTIVTSRQGNRPRLFQPLPMPSASVNAADGRILYHDKKGFENTFRKHERSAGTSDIWLLDPATNKFTQLTTFDGHDLQPVWAPDTDTYFYVSEFDGTLNVYSSSLDGSHKKQITHFKHHPVRTLSAATDGTLAYSWDGELYVQRPDGQPNKLNITIATDLYDPDQISNIRRTGADQMAVSPSGDEVAFTLRGDIYVTSTKYNTTRQITDTPGQERTITFSPDGRSLIYDSDRNGQWAIYRATIADTTEKQFTHASTIIEKPLHIPADSASAQQPAISPDGNYVAFLHNRNEIRIINLKDNTVTTALPGKFNYSYADGDIEYVWSPDSRWLLTSYIGVGGWNNTDIALVGRDGKTIIDLTESGYTDSNPHWALNGQALIYSTAKYGMKAHGSWGNQSDAVIMALTPEAWDLLNQTQEEADLAEKAAADKKEAKETKAKDKKASKKKKNDSPKPEAPIVADDQFDLPSRRYRTRRLTSHSSRLGDHFLSPKADKFYYVSSATEGGASLYVHDLRKGTTTILAKDISGQLIPDKDGKNLFVQSYDGSMTRLSLDDGADKPITFEAIHSRKPSAEREYIYDHMLTQVREKFYDPKLHGVDWNFYGQHYRKFLPHIADNRDFADLLSEILGELNASHTGGGTSASTPSLPTAELGIVIDTAWTGPGIKIAQILPQSPLAAKKTGIRPGDIISAIDNQEIAPGADYYPLLQGKAGRNTQLTIQQSPSTRRSVTIKPITAGEQREMLYRRWVENNERLVDSLSNGQIGYVHVKGMDTESFQSVYDRLLGHYRNAKAVVVDTRFNGGGWLHNDLAILLSGREYVRYTPRGQYIGSDPFSQWTKPSVMLVGESNYSDAHGTPYVYQTLGIGTVVGAPVPGTMTAVWWETQIDPAIYFGIPQVTSLNPEGKPLENHQLTPDILVHSHPSNFRLGRDPQIETAVNHLLQKLNSTK